MVSQNPTATNIPNTAGNRGLIAEEVAIVSGTGYVNGYYRPFWRPVIAGSLFAISLSALSWYLMLGCHVGVTESGLLALGAGAAVWIWITSCVAFFFGGMIASAISASRRDADGWLKGAALWGLSIPLALLIYATVAHDGLLLDLSLPRAGLSATAVNNIGGIAAGSFGFFWASFLTLACGLVFSIIGSMAGCACRAETPKNS